MKIKIKNSRFFNSNVKITVHFTSIISKIIDLSNSRSCLILHNKTAGVIYHFSHNLSHKMPEELKYLLKWHVPFSYLFTYNILWQYLLFCFVFFFLQWNECVVFWGSPKLKKMYIPSEIEPFFYFLIRETTFKLSMPYRCPNKT